MDAAALLEMATSGATPILAALALALGTIFFLDHRRARDPRRLANARMNAVLDHSYRDLQRDIISVDAKVFSDRREGLLGELVDAVDRYAAGLGGRAGLRALVFLAVAIGAGVGAGLLVFFQMPNAVSTCAGVGVAALSFMIIAGERRRRWILDFQDQLIEAVELFSRTIRTGYAVPAAIRHVGDELSAPVGPIFIRIADQEDIGIEPRKAIRDAARSVRLNDFTFFASRR